MATSLRKSQLVMTPRAHFSQTRVTPIIEALTDHQRAIMEQGDLIRTVATEIEKTEQCGQQCTTNMMIDTIRAYQYLSEEVDGILHGPMNENVADDVRQFALQIVRKEAPDDLRRTLAIGKQMVDRVVGTTPYVDAPPPRTVAAEAPQPKLTWLGRMLLGG